MKQFSEQYQKAHALQLVLLCVSSNATLQIVVHAEYMLVSACILHVQQFEEIAPAVFFSDTMYSNSSAMKFPAILPIKCLV